MELHTERLDLRPLPSAAAGALPDDRDRAAHVLGLALPADWPQVDLLDVLPLQARVGPSEECYGVWLIIERETQMVVGDIGFIGPPGADGSVEVGYSVIPDRRRRGYATEAARSIVGWALRQPGVRTVVAGCDEENLPSVRMLERIGFSRTGEANRQLRWRYGD
jgi:ribosomal-protein-alanine N-acetyltransferase